LISGTKVINPYAGSSFWAAIAATLIARVAPLEMIRQFQPQSILRYILTQKNLTRLFW